MRRIVITVLLGSLAAAGCGTDDADRAASEKEVALGVAAIGKHDYAAALHHASKAIELDPTHCDAYLCRGDACTWLDRFDNAVADYTTGIKADPGSAMAYLSRGQAYTHLNKYDEALADYRQVIALDPKWARPYADLADLYYHARKDYPAALKNYRKAVELNPGDVLSAAKVRELTKGSPDDNHP